MASPLLGGLSPAAFLARHWQKQARLVRGAIPGFAGLLPSQELFRLAARDDVESRLVIRTGRRWTVEHGPFRVRQLKALPPRNWTLLVQGLNLVLPAGEELLRRFSFIPYARLDDLMASHATPGGGVGPHFDSYDVFLLQGSGRRRWRVSTQADLELRPALPLKILRRFAPRQEWVLEPGDMLYLPPRYAHDGVALDICTTYSIGFRAPRAQELAVAFLQFLQDRINAEGIYADPGMRPTREPARVGRAVSGQIGRLLAPIRWQSAQVAQFTGCYLSEPKPQVFFSRPPDLLPRARFAQALARRGARLDLRTQMLYDETHLFINGESLPMPGDEAPALRELANNRRLPASTTLSAPLIDRLHGWYRDGYLQPDR